MALQIICPTCQKKLSVRDDWVGKRIKCPGCAGILAVSLPTPDDDVEREDAAEESDEGTQAAGRRTRRSKKRKGKSSRRAVPILILGGVELTLGKLALAGMVLIGIVGAALLILQSSFFSPAAEAQLVDVYTPVIGYRDTAVGARFLQSKTTAFSIPGPKKVIVTRPNPNAEYLLVTVAISSTEIAKYFAGERGTVSLATLSAEQIQLQSGSETLSALYAQDQNTKGRSGYHFSWTPPERDDYVPNLRDHLGPGATGWTHEGSTKDEGSTITFTGSRGMFVEMALGSKRLDGSEDHNPLSDLTGAKIGKGFGAGLVGAPAAYVLVTWDKQSTGWMLDNRIEQPNDLSLTWTIQCFFPRPKDGGKDAKLLVLGKQRNIRIR